MNQLNKALVVALWEATTSATPERAVMALAEMYETIDSKQIELAERYVRSCLVAQGLAQA